MSDTLPELTVPSSPWFDVEADWLILGVPESGGTSDELDAGLNGLLTQLRESGDFTGKFKQQHVVIPPDGPRARRLLLVGLGAMEAICREKLHDVAAHAARRVTDQKRGTIAMMVPTTSEVLTTSAVANAIGTGLMFGCVSAGLYKSEPSRYLPDALCLIPSSEADRDEVTEAAQRATVAGRAVALARELVNIAPQDLYPSVFARHATELASTVGLECDVWDDARLREEGMHAILGVGRGSEHPPRLVILRHTPKPGQPYLTYVGKGVTFDSGGLSLKASDQMADMKCDMAGAAAVLGAMKGIAELAIPLNVLAVIPLVENMPGGRAMKLGDVLRARNGKTIEILNTDAEGRVILADALSYVTEQEVTHVVDLATLTGACMVALGSDIAGLMSNDPEWVGHVQAAAAHAGEMVWPLPMHDHFDKALESKVADLKNAPSNRYGGAITAAKFLEQFVAGKSWAHLDIAGPSFSDGSTGAGEAGGTGFGVKTLIALASELATLAASDPA